MTQAGYVVAITALLPLTATMVLTQKNPYSALVMRGILGAVAALVYILFGAADVALTEALVGTMLSVMLYAIAVRSSMTLRLGVLAETATADQTTDQPIDQPHSNIPPALLSSLRQSLRSHHLRVEPIPYGSTADLKAALKTKDIHGACLPSTGKDTHQLHIRVPKLYDILKTHLPGETILLIPKPTLAPAPPSMIDSPYPRSPEIQP